MIEQWTAERSYVVTARTARGLFRMAAGWGLAQMDGRWQVVLYDASGNRGSTLILPHGMDYYRITDQRPN